MLELVDLLADIDVDALSDDEVRELLKEAEAAANAEKYGQFYQYFPDEGPLRRELYVKHLEFFKAGRLYSERLFLAANRVGKAQPVNEPVLTPSGFKPIGSFQIGDEVIGSDGKPTRVVGVYPQGRRPVVRLTASDGSNALCDLEHLWTVRTSRKGRGGRFTTLTARDLRDRIGERWMLPDRPVVEFDQPFQLPVPPYLLGILLGDGGLSNESVMLSTEDTEIVDYARGQAAEFGCELRHAGRCTWHFSTRIKRGGRHDNVLASLLEGLGLRGKTAHSKRVPSDYLQASAENRIELLRGLMDTDGSCSKSNGARQFYSVSRGLCEDVAFLARSLGMNAFVKPKNGRYQGEPHLSWRVHIAASPTSIFNLKRKRANERFGDARGRGVMVESIIDAGEEECVCIEVEASDSLYLTRDFLVTHNTIAGGYEGTCHLTGQYPHWWEGRVWNRPTRMWAAGDFNETTRDVIQKKMLGGVEWYGDKKGVDGTGMVPRDTILQDSITWKAGVPDLIDTVRIDHRNLSGTVDGSSVLGLKSYQQGRRSFQGTEQDVIWTDEEPPMEVYGEMLIRLMTTKGLAMLTFTPLMGWTDVVESFYPERG